MHAPAALPPRPKTHHPPVCVRVLSFSGSRGGSRANSREGEANASPRELRPSLNTVYARGIGREAREREAHAGEGLQRRGGSNGYHHPTPPAHRAGGGAQRELARGAAFNQAADYEQQAHGGGGGHNFRGRDDELGLLLGGGLTTSPRPDRPDRQGQGQQPGHNSPHGVAPPRDRLSPSAAEPQQQQQQQQGEAPERRGGGVQGVPRHERIHERAHREGGSKLPTPTHSPRVAHTDLRHAKGRPPPAQPTGLERGHSKGSGSGSNGSKGSGSDDAEEIAAAAISPASSEAPAAAPASARPSMPRIPPGVQAAYAMQSMLGAGAFGTVWMATARETGEGCAIKIVERKRQLHEDFSLEPAEVRSRLVVPRASSFDALLMFPPRFAPLPVARALLQPAYCLERSVLSPPEGMAQQVRFVP